MQLKIFGAIAIALMFAAPAAWAEPSVAQVTQAVQAGRLDQAQSMMQEVLVAHPQSAEAQYLEARISARQGNWAAAAAALQKSEQLAPGMPFVKPQVLTSFKKSVQGHVNKPVGKISKESRWGTVLAFFLGLVALIALISMLLRRRQRANMIYRGQPFGGGVNGYGPMNPGGAMGGMPQQGGGLGSSLASGIATGVGVGAGLAAGQALAGSLFGHGNESDNTASDNHNNDLGLTDDSWGNDPLASNDDFGLDDGGDSWG